MSCRVLKLVVWYHATAGVWAGKLSCQSNVGVSALLRHRAEYCSANAGNNCWGHLCHDNATYITILHHSSFLFLQSLTSTKKTISKFLNENHYLPLGLYGMGNDSQWERPFLLLCTVHTVHVSVECCRGGFFFNSYYLVALGRLGLVQGIAGIPSKYNRIHRKCDNLKYATLGQEPVTIISSTSAAFD